MVFFSKRKTNDRKITEFFGGMTAVPSNENERNGKTKASSKPSKRLKKVKSTQREIVLDIVAERKTNVDLSSSIKDGRYVEQKLRLK